MSCKSKFTFNTIANVISIASGVTLAGIVGVGAYVFINKDAIVDNIKSQAIEAVTGSLGGALGGDLSIGAPDLAPSPDQAATPPVGGGLGLSIPSNPL